MLRTLKGKRVGCFFLSSNRYYEASNINLLKEGEEVYVWYTTKPFPSILKSIPCKLYCTQVITEHGTKLVMSPILENTCESIVVRFHNRN